MEVKVIAEKIKFNSNGQRVEGTLIMPEKISGRVGGVIFFHGMTSNEKNYIPIAEKIAELGMVGLTINFRGNGISEGDSDYLKVSDALLDGINAYDFLAQQDFIDKNKIGICGASLGGAIAAGVSAKKEVRSLVLRAPAVYTNELMHFTYSQIMADEKRIFYKKIIDLSDTPAIQSISIFNGNLLVITSEKDSIIPGAITDKYIEGAKLAQRKELYEIKGATHRLLDDLWRNQFINKTVDWFKETL